MAKSKSYLVADPLNHIFDVAAARGSYTHDLNVFIKGDGGRFIHNIKCESAAHVEHINTQVMLLILSFQEGERIEPDWDLPIPSAKTSTKKTSELNS